MLPCRGWIERRAVELSALPGGPEEDFSQPAGEPALVSADSVSWQVFKNPVSILVGGIAAVVLELAEPRVRTGVYEHSNFRTDPMGRLRRTGRATMVTVYGAASRAEALIARVNGIHAQLSGTTNSGQRYRATDTELSDWVYSTASFGFMTARHDYVSPISSARQDRFYVEGQTAARLYGALGAPRSRAEQIDYFRSMEHALEPSPLIFEFLETMQRLPLFPAPAMPLQRILVKAAVKLLPEWSRTKLGLGDAWLPNRWQLALVRRIARTLDRIPLRSGPPVQACRRLGVPDDFLYRHEAS